MYGFAINNETIRSANPLPFLTYNPDIGVIKIMADPSIYRNQFQSQTPKDHCNYCGKEIIPHAGKGRKRYYCSDDCKAAVDALRAKNKRARNKPHPGSCEQCGKQIPIKAGKKQPRKYCSMACRIEANKLREKSYNKTCKYCKGLYLTNSKDQSYCSRKCQHDQRREESEKKRVRKCQWCGKEFVMHTQSGKARKGEVKEGLFCSRDCRGLHLKDQPRKNPPSCKVWFKECDVCGEMFTARYKDTIFCSDECRYERIKASKRMKYKSNWIQPEPFKCKMCGELYQPEYGDMNSVFCSKKCGKRYQRKCRGDRDAKSRALQYGVGYEPINPLKVFKRDGWHCQICGKATPKKNRGTYYTNAPELDHRIPISRGGDHLYSNVQCACRKCNGRKSNNNELGQLPLFEIMSKG